LDVMGVYETSWAPWLLVEANKFWFYSLSLSLLISAIELAASFAVEATSADIDATNVAKDVKMAAVDEKNGTARLVSGNDEKKLSRNAEKRSEIVKRLIVDACDLISPGSITGWTNVSAGTVGMGAAMSTALTSREVWDKVQARSKH
jgi:hypothetical protein